MDLVQICPRLERNFNCFLKRKHSTKNKVFNKCFFTLECRVVQYWSRTRGRDERWISWRFQTIPEKDINGRWRFQGGLGSSPGVLEWLVARFQGIPSWACWYYQFPENVARRSWRPGILYQA